MYYLMMKTAFKPNFDSKTFFHIKSYTRLKEKNISLVNIKFYQKLFIVLLSLSTFLIFPESPTELENICEIHNPRTLCKVW